MKFKSFWQWSVCLLWQPFSLVFQRVVWDLGCGAHIVNEKAPFDKKKVQSNRLLNTHGLKGVKKFKPLCNMHCLLSRMNGKHKLNMIWLSFLWFPLLSPILITFKLKRKTTLTTCLFSILLLFQLINIINQLLHPEDKI